METAEAKATFKRFPTLLPTRAKLLVTCSPSQLSVCPLRTAGSLQSSLHPLQAELRPAPAVWKPVWCRGQSPVFLCHCLAHVVLTISEGQNGTEGETFVLSSYSLTFPRLSVSTKAGDTGLVSKGCSDVQD